jgi:hypothetical protein
MHFEIIVVQYEPESDSELRRWTSHFEGTQQEANEAANREYRRLRDLGFGGIGDWYAKQIL